jgi:two-component system, LytTR family, sensor kinase
MLPDKPVPGGLSTDEPNPTGKPVSLATDSTPPPGASNRPNPSFSPKFLADLPVRSNFASLKQPAMETPVTINLTFSQKARLAASIFAIYWPLRIYLNVDSWNWLMIQRGWMVWIIEVPLTILFFIGWLSVTEWLEARIFKRPAQDFLIDFKWPAQVATLVIASALAVLFNLGFHTILRSVGTLVNRSEKEAAAVRAAMPEWSKNPEIKAAVWQVDGRRRGKANNGLTVMAMLMAFYVAANRRGYRELTQLRVNAEQLKREATQAQFVALRNQVNPHFLFNSLSILSSLVEVDTKLSVRFIKQLSKVYRYILEQRDSEKVSLKTELEFLESYSFLLNIRFDGKLKILDNVPAAEASRYHIAPLTLQLLVENAVKHNRMSQEEPLVVSIDVQEDYLLVVNPLQRRPQVEDSTGLGLENIANRYALLTDKPVSIGEEEGKFVIKLPLL